MRRNAGIVNMFPCAYRALCPSFEIIPQVQSSPQELHGPDHTRQLILSVLLIIAERLRVHTWSKLSQILFLLEVSDWYSKVMRFNWGHQNLSECIPELEGAELFRDVCVRVRGTSGPFKARHSEFEFYLHHFLDMKHWAYYSSPKLSFQIRKMQLRVVYLAALM